RNRVAEEVGRVLLPQEAHHGRAADDVPAVDAEGLAEGPDEDVGAAAGDFLGAAAGRTEAADAVRVVDEKDHAAREARVELLADARDAIERRVVAAHAENSIGDDDGALRAGRLGEGRFQL